MTSAPFHAWRLALETGLDITGDLTRLGVPVDDLGRPDRQAARAAWLRFGKEILVGRHRRMPPPWGQLQWGQPWLDQGRAA